MAREEDGFAAREPLRPPLRGLALCQRDQRFRLTAGRGTRITFAPFEALGVNAIVPSSAQEPPRGCGASQSVTAAPPERAIFFIRPSAKNPTDWPSGDQNGS